MRPDATDSDLDAPGPSMTSRAARGVAWTSALAMVERVAAFAMQIVLAGLLPLEVWGAWGIAMSVLVFMSGFASTGIRQVLIHRRSSYRLWSGPAIWLTTLWGVLLSAVFLALATPAATLLVEEDSRSSFVTAMLVLAPVPLLTAMVTVPRAKLSIDYRFKASALSFTLPGIAQSAATVALALMGFGLLSFAIPATGAMLLRLVASVWLARTSWRARPRFRVWRYLLGDAGRVWVETVATWTRNQADVLIVGMFSDQDSVGLYTFARNMSRQMVRLFTLQVAGVLAPIMAGIRDDRPRALAAFLRASRVLAFVGVPVTLGIAAVVWVGMPLLLDAEKWAELPPILAVMCLGIGLRVLTEPAVALMFAVGRFSQQLRFSVVSSVGFCVCVLVGAWLGGAFGASVGFAVFGAVAGPTQFWLSIVSLGGRWMQALASVVLPVVVSLASIVPWVVLAGALEVHDAVRVALVVVGSAAGYVAIARVRRAAELREMVDRLDDQVPGRFRPMMDRVFRVVAGARPAGSGAARRE